jgi:hypothetical protein
VPYAAARVWDVTSVARNDVNVEMRNRLTSGLAHVHTQVETVRSMTSKDLLASRLDGIGERLLFWGGCVEPTPHVTTSHQKRVSNGHRERVPKADDELGLQEDACRIWVTEWALRLRHMNRLSAGDLFGLELALKANSPALRAAPARHPPPCQPGKMADGTEVPYPHTVGSGPLVSAADQRCARLKASSSHQCRPLGTVGTCRTARPFPHDDMSGLVRNNLAKRPGAARRRCDTNLEGIAWWHPPRYGRREARIDRDIKLRDSWALPGNR